MKLTVLGSNSLGNCYILETNNEALIIEAGVRFSEVKKALKFKISKVVGAVISHEHNDHAGYIKEFINAGIMTLALEEVFKAKGFDEQKGSFYRAVKPKQGYRIGGFSIIPLGVKHDVPCVSFIIDHPDMGRLLFVTDTMMFEYQVPGLNHVLIEANYADDILDKNIERGKMPISMRPRLLQSHMEINTTLWILRRIGLMDIHNIVLIHLSDGNSSEERFVKSAQELTGKQVYAANKGLTIDISKNPY